MPESEIEELRARWEAERSPGLTLRLAERYREAGSLEDALEVLAASLEREPEHAAARVAKGRCHLDLGQLDQALGEFGGVVRSDPAHLWANQFLAQVHLEAGELARARDRIDLVALLGGDTAELESRIAGGVETPAVSEAPIESAMPDEETVVPEELPAADAVAPSDEPFELPEPVATEGLTVEPQAPVADAPSTAAAAVSVFGEGDPFQLGDWIEVEETTSTSDLFDAKPFDLPEAEPSASAAVDVAPGDGEADDDADDTAATLTLAELYRRQGHPEEAATIFREILERQPGNVDAARALGELEKGKGWPLSANDLLKQGDDAVERTEPSPAGEVLKRYRSRLRGKD